jgi:hypothetical protein
VQLDSLKQLYAGKTDEELLALAEQKDSLVENAKLALFSELDRRNLLIPAESTTIAAQPAGEAESNPMPETSKSAGLWLALFFLDTVLVYICALYLSPMLAVRWFAWILPIIGIGGNVTPADWYLRHLELATIVPAVFAGYVDIARLLPATVGKQIATWRSGSAANWVWIVPTMILLWGLVTFHAPSSVLYGNSTSAFGHYFDIQRVMPTFANPLVSDPVRVRSQMFVTAPFYAGLAFSLGAWAWAHQLLPTLFKRFS